MSPAAPAMAGKFFTAEPLGRPTIFPIVILFFLIDLVSHELQHLVPARQDMRLTVWTLVTKP